METEKSHPVNNLDGASNTEDGGSPRWSFGSALLMISFMMTIMLYAASWIDTEPSQRMKLVRNMLRFLFATDVRDQPGDDRPG